MAGMERGEHVLILGGGDELVNGSEHDKACEQNESAERMQSRAMGHKNESSHSGRESQGGLTPLRMWYNVSRMTLNIQIPEELERKLRAETPNLDATAKEAIFVALFRQGRLTHKQISEALGLDRWQAEAVLKNHNVVEDLPSIGEVREQILLSHQLRANG